jgi:hypothetical protein
MKYLNSRYAVPAFLALLLLAGTVMGQLQQSGGAGSAVSATQSGTWTVQPGNTANTTAWKVDGSAVTQPVSVASMPSTPVTGTFWQATQPVSGTVSIVPKTACGNTLASGSTLAAVPTSSTLLSSAATACVVKAVFFNTNATAATVTFTDNTATPINAILSFSIPGSSNLIEDLGGGAFNLGVKWAANTTGVTGYVVAYQ